VANERAFSAHAAHALRTPLAGIDTQLAVAQREAPRPMQPRLARVREAAARLTRVVSALLALFRSGAELQWQALDLPALLARLPHEALDLHFAGPGPLQADADLLTASAHQPAGQRRAPRRHRTCAAAWRPKPACSACVCTTTAAADPERRADLADALDSQAYEGRMGLGLMLADLVARAHGGRLLLPVVDTRFCGRTAAGPARRPHEPLRCLVTGFEPFDGDPLNPSWLIAQSLHGLACARHARAGRAAALCSFDGRCRRCGRAAPPPPACWCWRWARPARGAISLERVALNVIDARIPTTPACSPSTCRCTPGRPRPTSARCRSRPWRRR
jgi:hypothetical protein